MEGHFTGYSSRAEILKDGGEKEWKKKKKRRGKG